MDIKGGTIEISGVKIMVKMSTIKNLIDMRSEISKLKVGDLIEVDGAFSGAGEMLATEIERVVFDRDQIEGKLEKIDSNAQTLMIGGITVKILENTKIKGEGGSVISLKELALAVGSPLECKGTWTGSKEFSSSNVKVEKD